MASALGQGGHDLGSGALYMSLAMFMGSAIDVAVKALADDYTTSQIVFLRCLIAVPFVLTIVRAQVGLAMIARPRWGWQLYRGLLAAGANFGFFYGVGQLELVTAILLAYISPILIVLLARPMLGEVVGWRRWLGVSIAVFGVLWVLQPAEIKINTGAWAVLGSALCWALLSLSNRQLAGQVSPAILTFYTLPISGILAGVLTVGEWQTPLPTDWVFFGIAGVAGSFVHLFVAQAYLRAPASAVAPFEYTTLLWTSLAGYLFWQEQPSVQAWVGGSAIIIGGYLVLRQPKLRY